MGNGKKIIAILAVVLFAGYMGVKIYAGNMAKEKLDQALTRVANIADVEYDKVSVDLLGLKVHIRGVKLSPVGEKQKTEIDEIVIHDIDGGGEIPTYLHVVLNGIKGDIDGFGQGAADLKALGYEEISGDLELDYRYDHKGKRFHLNTLRVGARDMGSVNMSLHLSNIDLGPDNIFNLLFSYGNLLITGAELTYEDDSLLTRLQKQAAKEQGTDVESLIKKITREIDMTISHEEDELTKQGLKAIKKFLARPDRLSISINPQKPVPLGNLQRIRNPNELIKLLNIEIDV